MKAQVWIERSVRYFAIQFALIGVLLSILSMALLGTAHAWDDVGEFVNVDDIVDDGNADSDPNVDLVMLDPTYSGSGCPNGTASFALTEDRKTLSLLFDQFIARAGRSTGLSRENKDCNIKIPFAVPAGYQATVTRIDFRGFYSLPRAGRAQLISSFVFYNGTPLRNRVVRRKVFSGPLDSDYAVSGTVSSGAVMSECGQSFELRINAHMMAMSNAARDDALATVDSLDAIARPGVPALPELRYHLRWKKCASTEASSGSISGGSNSGPRGSSYNPRPRR